jgi:hypothetical protein
MGFLNTTDDKTVETFTTVYGNKQRLSLDPSIG